MLICVSFRIVTDNFFLGTTILANLEFVPPKGREVVWRINYVYPNDYGHFLQKPLDERQWAKKKKKLRSEVSSVTVTTSASWEWKFESIFEHFYESCSFLWYWWVFINIYYLIHFQPSALLYLHYHFHFWFSLMTYL